MHVQRKRGSARPSSPPMIPQKGNIRSGGGTTVAGGNSGQFWSGASSSGAQQPEKVFGKDTTLVVQHISASQRVAHTCLCSQPHPSALHVQRVASAHPSPWEHPFWLRSSDVRLARNCRLGGATMRLHKGNLHLNSLGCPRPQRGTRWARVSTKHRIPEAILADRLVLTAPKKNRCTGRQQRSRRRLPPQLLMEGGVFGSASPKDLSPLNTAGSRDFGGRGVVTDCRCQVRRWVSDVWARNISLLPPSPVCLSVSLSLSLSRGM